jgi:hypothetical protein
MINKNNYHSIVKIKKANNLIRTFLVGIYTFCFILIKCGAFRQG